MHIVTIPALHDNYIFLLLDDSAPQLAVIDPGVAAPVLAYLQKSERSLAAILNTHHHRDHTGGNQELLQNYPGIPVYGSAGDHGRIPRQSHYLRDGDLIHVCGATASILEVPGHTRAHIAYYFAGRHGAFDLFSGDTVFGGTIGNLFEGTPEIMFASMQKIRALPASTRIWCAHEYTLQYVRESAAIDPDNAQLAARLQALESAAASGQATVPLLLEEECRTNPFFRWDDARLNQRLAQLPGLATFRHLCEMT